MMLGFEEIERLIDRAAKGTSEGESEARAGTRTRGGRRRVRLRVQ